MKKARRHVINIAIFIIALILLFFIGGTILYWKIEDIIITSIHKLKEDGIILNYSFKEVSLINRSAYVKDVTIEFIAPHPLSSSTITLPSVSISEVSIIPLLFRNEIIINSIKLNRPRLNIYYVKHDTIPVDTIKDSVFEVKLNQLLMDSANLQLINKNSDKLEMEACVSANIKGLSIDISEVLHLTTENVVVNKVLIDLPTHFYKISFDKFSYNRANKLVQLDSILLVPTLTKIDFARKSIYETDQITVTIPSLTAHGFEMAELVGASFTANTLYFSFNLDVFHDKRFPELKRKPFILPAEFMHKLPFQLKIDSVKIHSSYISYTEFPDKALQSGNIFFNNLNVVLTNISTADAGQTEMHVLSRFMDAGNLTANFTFPLENKKLYTVNGILENFSMPSINAMITPLENIKFESGKMQAMQFHFQYNEQVSTGKLELDYSDLKVSIIQNNKPQFLNKITTLLANTLLKNTMNKTVLKYKRTGEIYFPCDPNESIFGLWWKSLLAGIKSVFTVEKILSRNHEKEVTHSQKK